MVVDAEAALCGSLFLAALDFLVAELFDAATLQAHNVVVMTALVEFEHSLATFEVVAHQQARLLELGQYPVNGGQSDILACRQQHLVNVFRAEVALRTVLE